MFKFYRVQFLFIIIFLIFSFILFDIFSLQVTEYSSVEEEIKNQTFQEYYIPAPRGEIYDYKNIKLVKTNIEQYLFINLRKINDENLDLYKQLIKFNFIELTNEDIEDIFNSKEVLEPIYSLQKIDFSIQKQLLEYDAFEIFELPMREYLYSNVFSHSIGYVGIPNSEEEKEYVNAKGNKLVGKNGLEKFYENSLAGVPGKVIFKGDQIIEYIDPIPGQDLTVTLNIELQEVVIESLIEGLNLANKNFESVSNIERGAVVVLNIETGAVEAMVSLPDFDPNLFVDGISQFDFTRLDRKQAFNNFAIQGLYPPGSVFKVVAYWLAVSENIFPVELNSKDDSIDCTGNLSFGFDDGSKQVYNDWKLEGHGLVNLRESLKQSCNVYFWDIALKIWREFGNTDGESLLQEYAKDLGFSKLTNVDLPYEKVGIVPDRQLFEEWKVTRPELVRDEGWLGGDLMNLIIGQGAITTTPLQVANAYRTLIVGQNSSPYLNLNATRIINNNINISNEFSNFLLDDLGSVTNRGGTAYKAFSIIGDEIGDIGGKTGTAQNAGNKNNTSWFVGIDSISKPKYVIATVVDEGGSGSAVAAPISRRVIQFLRGLEPTPVEFGEITE
jgi:penicillin-binding protein 2